MKYKTKDERKQELNAEVADAISKNDIKVALEILNHRHPYSFTSTQTIPGDWSQSGSGERTEDTVNEVEEESTFTFSAHEIAAHATSAKSDEMKKELAKLAVVKCRNDAPDLKALANGSYIPEVMNAAQLTLNEGLRNAKKCELLTRLSTLSANLADLQTSYDKRKPDPSANVVTNFFKRSVPPGKQEELDHMIAEVLRLKASLEDTSANVQLANTWTLDPTIAALADKKSLHGYAVRLDELQTEVTRFLDPAPSAAAAPAAKSAPE